MAMFSEHFLYDGVSCELHDIAICRFDAPENKISAGASIKLETCQPAAGYRWNAVSAQYEEPLRISFQFFHTDGSPFDSLERRAIAKWLLRNDRIYRWLQFDDSAGGECFQVICTRLDWITYNDYNGGEAVFIADSPWGYTKEMKRVIPGNSSLAIHNFSDSFDPIYPSVKLEVKQAGDITISNAIENRDTVLRNCAAGEMIEMNPDTRTITSTVSGHLLYNDFNYKFLRLSQTGQTGKNQITVTGNAVITLIWREARRCLL